MASRVATRRRSMAAENMNNIFEEMQLKEARDHLQIYLKQIRKGGRGVPKPGSEMEKRDLQQLACSWKLNRIRNFWTDYPTNTDLLRVLSKHARKLEAEGKAHVVPTDEDDDDHPAIPGEWRDTLSRTAEESYSLGDLFGTRGNYDDGMIYASRRKPRRGNAIEKKERDAVERVESSKEEGSAAGNDEEGRTRSEKSEEPSMFEQLRLNSTSVLADLSEKEENCDQIATSETLHSVFETWRSATNSNIKTNCARTITNIFSRRDMNQDDMLLPMFGLASSDATPEVLARCVRAVHRRMAIDRALDPVFIPGVVATVSAVSHHPDMPEETYTMSAEILRRMLLITRIDSEVDGLPPREAADRKVSVKSAAENGAIPLLVSLLGLQVVETMSHAMEALYLVSELQLTHPELAARATLGVILKNIRHDDPRVSDPGSLILFELLGAGGPLAKKLLEVPDVPSTLTRVAKALASRIRGKSIEELEAAGQVVHLSIKASHAVRNMSADPELSSVVMASGGGEALFVFAFTPHRQISYNGFSAMCNLFRKGGGYDRALLKLGFVGAVVDILAANADATDDLGVEKLALAASCVHLLANDPAEVQNLLQKDASATLIKIAPLCDNLSMQADVTEAIQRIADHKVSHPSLLSHGIVGILSSVASKAMNMYEAEAEEAKEAAAKQEAGSKKQEAQQARYEERQEMLDRTTEAVTMALVSLTLTPESHPEMLKNNVIEILARLVKRADRTAACVSAFCQLSASREAHDPIVKAGVLPLIISQSRFSSTRLRRDCAQALCNLSCVEGRESVMLEAGVASALSIMALFRADDGLTKDLCAASLFNFMFDAAGREFMLSDGVLWAFIKLAQSVPERGSVDAVASSGDLPASDGRETCTRLIHNLCCDDRLVSKCTERRIVTALARFSKAINPATRVNTGAALCEMARRPALQEPIITRGCMDILWGLTVTRGIDTAMRAAVALLRMTENETTREIIVEDDNYNASARAAGAEAYGVVDVMHGILNSVAALCNGDAEAGKEELGTRTAIAVGRAAVLLSASPSENVLAGNGLITLSTRLVEIAISGGTNTLPPCDSVTTTLGCSDKPVVAIYTSAIATLYNLVASTRSSATRFLNSAPEVAYHALRTALAVACGQVPPSEASGMGGACTVSEVGVSEAAVSEVTGGISATVKKMLCHSAILVSQQQTSAVALHTPSVLRNLTKLACDSDDCETKSMAAGAIANIVAASPTKRIQSETIKGLVEILAMASEANLHRCRAVILNALDALTELPPSSPRPTTSGTIRERGGAEEKAADTMTGIGAIAHAGGIKVVSDTAVAVAVSQSGYSESGSGMRRKTPPDLSRIRQQSMASLNALKPMTPRTPAAKREAVPEPETAADKQYWSLVNRICARVLVAAARVPSLRPILAESGVKGLMALAHTAEPSIQAHVAEALEALTLSDKNRAKLHEANAVPALAKLAARPGITKPTQSHCAAALRNISSDTALGATLESAGVVQSVLMLLPAREKDEDEPVATPALRLGSPELRSIGGTLIEGSDDLSPTMFSMPAVVALAEPMVFPVVLGDCSVSENSSGRRNDDGADPDRVPIWDKVLDFEGLPKPFLTPRIPEPEPQTRSPREGEAGGHESKYDKPSSPTARPSSAKQKLAPLSGAPMPPRESTGEPAHDKISKMEHSKSGALRVQPIKGRKRTPLPSTADGISHPNGGTVHLSVPSSSGGHSPPRKGRHSGGAGKLGGKGGHPTLPSR